MTDSLLPPLPVALPLLVAAVLLGLDHLLPRRWAPDLIATLTALACAGLCAFMARRAEAGLLLHWFGGWTPREGVALGISFLVDPAGAWIGVLTGLLFAASFVFAWDYFEEVGPYFHVMMLTFLAAMNGFCLTHDLFNLFVWFEVMSVAAFALTGYRLESAALEGALHFTITNTIGSYFMLAGIGLVYARVGALDFAAIAQGLHQGGPDAVSYGAFALIACGLLIKAAQAPFHFWLSDAHAVAPSPVCVVFSGAMVGIGVFGLGRLSWSVFEAPAGAAMAAHRVIMVLAALSAVIGGVMCLTQRHVKRLLAFSTIAHTGILLLGTAALTEDGAAGTLLYLAGHGLTKGALFMLAGILMAKLGDVDEIRLRGQGRGLPLVGIAFGCGGLLLAGLPVGILDEGVRGIDTGVSQAGHLWTTAAVVIGTSLTGAAVLRVTARVFLGWGPAEQEEKDAPTAHESERSNRPVWLMLAPAGALLAAALGAGSWAAEIVRHAAPAFVHPPGWDALAGGGAYAMPPPLPRTEAPHPFLPWLSLGLALLVAGYELGQHRLPNAASALVTRLTGPLFTGLQALHTRIVGDYVAWLVFGLALLAGGMVIGGG